MQSDESDNEEKSKSDENHKVTKVENVDELELHDELSNDSWTQPVLRGKFNNQPISIQLVLKRTFISFPLFKISWSHIFEYFLNKKCRNKK